MFQKNKVLSSISINVIFLFVLVLTGFIGLSKSVAQTSSMDSGDVNRNYLIDKLQKVVVNLAPSDSSRNGIILRLADLLSERARRSTMLANEGSCKGCVSPDLDRKKALQYYAEALPKVAENNQPKVLIQMGHLHQLLGQQSQAIESYNKIISNTEFDSKVRAEAYLSIAEMHFKKSEWGAAAQNYSKSIELSSPESKGFATYKLGWSEFNLGKVTEAKKYLLSVLQSPAMLSKAGTTETVIDQAFHEQVSKDFSTISASQFKEEDLKNIFEFSPEKKKFENLFVVSNELERTGKKKEAITAWTYLYQNQANPQDRAVTKAHLANIKLQLSQGKEALADMNESFQAVQTFGDKFSSEKEDIRRLAKSSIVTWNQAEKKAPSSELLESYEGYLNTFGYEKEMSQWAVQVASERKNWSKAWALHSAATQSFVKNNTQDLENHLLLGVELGEMSKEESLKRASLDEYLSNSVSKSKYWEVLYQKAYAGYEKAENETFLSELENLVKAEKAPMDLRVKSGDLYLDYLASKKRDAQIGEKANYFNSLLTGKKGYSADWAQLSQKSILNQVASSVDQKNYEAAWTQLNQFQIKLADKKDVPTFFKNKIILSEKRADLATAIKTAEEMSSSSLVESKDKVFAQVKLAYYSDLKMDFKNAMKLTEKLPTSVLPTDKKNLRLSMYSNLLGQSSAQYLKEYINSSTDAATKEAAAIEVIKQTVAANGNVDEEIKKYEKLFSKNNEVLGELAAYSYSKSFEKSYGFKMVTSKSDVKNSKMGQLVLSDIAIKSMNMKIDKIKTMTLDTDTSKKNYQKTLAQGIQSRVNALTDLDVVAAEAIKSKDWASQVISLTAVSKESERFFNEIMSLPMPENLSPEEQSEYMRLLGEKAQPFKAKSEQASAKVKEFWSDANWEAQLKNKMESEFSVLAQNEKSALEKVAQGKELEQLNSLNLNIAKSNLSNPKSATGVASTAAVGGQKNVTGTDLELNAALEKVKADPFNTSHVELLKEIENKNGNKVMVQYLENRLTEMSSSIQSLNETTGNQTEKTKGVK